jgi:hypothetical protein
MSTTDTTPPERIRLTISVTPEVHATFTRLAAAGSMSISRAMGDWLADTIDAAEFMAAKMEEARSAPKKVARQLHAYALGLADETGALIEDIRTKAAAERKAQRAPAPAASIPPSSNTGGKGPQEVGLSFPKTCPDCGAPWSMNHKCKPGKRR